MQYVARNWGTMNALANTSIFQNNCFMASRRSRRVGSLISVIRWQGVDFKFLISFSLSVSCCGKGGRSQ